MQEENKNKFIICPKCNGSGKNNLGINCSYCEGAGAGVFFNRNFLYFGMKIGTATISLDHLRKKIHLIINLSAFAFGFAGFLSLAFWIYGVSIDATELKLFAFWKYQNIFILIFWLSLIADMFVYYRLSEEERLKHKISPLSYSLKNKEIKIPQSWESLNLSKFKRLDVVKAYSNSALEVMEKSFELAKKLGHGQIDPLHIFFASFSDREVAACFSRLNINSEKLMIKVKKHISLLPTGKSKINFSLESREVLIKSYMSAYNFGQKKVSPKNFIIPILENKGVLKEILYDFEVDIDKIFNVILWFVINEKQIESYKAFKSQARFKPSTNMDRAYTSVATPMLDQMAYDLTLAAKWGHLEYCVARDKEIEKIWQHLESGENGILLVGEKGVGKNTLISGIAQLMVRENVPKFLQDKRLVELDAARLISGVTPAQSQGRLLSVINEMTRAGNIVLYIKDIENLIGISSGEEESLDLSEVLSSALERKNIYCFASATNENYIKYIEGKSLGNAMAKLEVNEAKGNQAIQIIESKIGHFEGKYKVYFSYNAIETVIELSDKFIHDKYLPQKAVKILEMVAVQVSKEKGENAIVSKNDIARIISDTTGIPATKITETESQQLLKLEDRIHERMVNQKEAVKMVSASLRRARTELRKGDRPIANFLFLGPTGVGKTELAKAVSQIYFGNEDYMIRIDMSEYQHPDSIKKMIGSSSGAKGYLTEKVRKSPFSLILLDEVEKAHPDILNLFLQVMDDGRLTDGQGKTINFTNSIIIATSNAGANFIQSEILKGSEVEEIKTVLINDYLNQVMRPELINRFDGVIVFSPLSQENVVDICKLMLNGIAKLLKEKGIELEATEEGTRVLAKLGFDPKFGARPLRRLLQDKVEDSIASKILEGHLRRRDTVVIDEEGEIQVRKGQEI